MTNHEQIDSGFPPLAVVAEKDPMHRGTLAAFLSCDGYRVFEEDNENAVLSCIDSANRLAVLFVDLDMPGWRSLAWYALNTMPDAFVIGFRGNNAVPEDSDLEQFGIQVCLQKPILYNDVRRVLSETVEK